VKKEEHHAYSAPPLLPSDGSALSHVPGELERQKKRDGIILRRARFMQRAQETLAHAVRIYTRGGLAVDAFFSFLKVATIGIFALIALVLVLLAIPQTRFKSTLTEFLAWFGFLGASGLVVSPVDLIPDVLPVIGWSDDLGYALLALVCGYIGWNLRRRRLTGQPAGRPLLLPFFRETIRLWHGWRALRARLSR
jgi:hypothetical protein